MVHGTRSKGKQKVLAVLEISSDDDEMAPLPKRQVVVPPSPQAGPAPPSPLASLASLASPAPRREPSSSVPPTVHRSAGRASSADALAVAHNRATRIPAASASTSSARPSLPPVASTSAAQAQPRARPKAPRGKPRIAGSDDELDDFFTRKPIQAKRIPKGRGPAAAAAPATAVPPSSDEEDNEPDDDDADNSGPKVRAVKLPEWAYSKSGAEKKAAEIGHKPNRKRRKMDESDEDDEVAATADKDDLAESKATKVPVLESDSDDSDDSLTYETVAKPDKGKGKGRGLTRERSASMSPPIPAKSSAGTEFQSFQELQEQRKRRKESATIDLSDGEDDASEDGASATASPLANPDTTLDFMNDPEFSAMIRSAKAEAQDGSDDVLIVPNDRDASAQLSDAEAEPAADDDVEVTIHISLVWDPDRAAPEAVKRNYEQISEYICGLNEPFERIFSEFADLKAVPKSSLVFTHSQSRAYAFGTPKSVKIFHSGDLKAYPSEVYHKIERSKKERVITSKPDSSEPVDEDGHEGDDLLRRARSITREASVIRTKPDDLQANSDGEGPAPRGIIRVTVRGSQTMTLGLAVKTTTTIGQLLRHYCKHFEIDLAELPGMWAEFEGERLDNAQTLGSCDDVEDGQIDVRRAK